MDEKRICVFFSFIEEHISELLFNLNRWAMIFKTEKEDRTNKKHIRHLKKVREYSYKIIKIHELFSYTLRKATDNYHCNYPRKHD